MPVILSVDANAPQASVIAKAAAIVREGGLVAFPTETVYGLAANAAQPSAIERLNRVKGRPPEKPYSMHLYEPAQAREFVGVVSPLAQQLMARFWPGPLTIVMAAKDQTTVGFRCPDHRVAQAFLKACACPVVAPSANRSGFPPPTDSAEVIAALGGQFDALLEAGPTPLGRESTVVSVVGDRLAVLREGAIAAATIYAALAARES